MRLLTSSRILFPHTGSGRLLLCKSISKLLVLIVKHVQYSFIQEPETGKHLVLPLVYQTINSFRFMKYVFGHLTESVRGMLLYYVFSSILQCINLHDVDVEIIFINQDAPIDARWAVISIFGIFSAQISVRYFRQNAFAFFNIFIKLLESMYNCPDF